MHDSVYLSRVRSASADAGFCTRCGQVHHGVASGLMAARCANCRGFHVWHILPLIDHLTTVRIENRSYKLEQVYAADNALTPENAFRLSYWGVPDRPQETVSG